jgi:hypothetical protein
MSDSTAHGQVEANKFCNTSSTTLNEAVAKVRRGGHTHRIE